MKRYRYQNPFQSGDNHKTMAKGDLKKIKSYSQELLHKKCQYLPKNFYKSDPPPPPNDAVVLKGFDLKKKYIFKNVKNPIQKNYNTTIGDIIKQASSDSVHC